MSLSDSFPRDFLEKHKEGQKARISAQITSGTVVKLWSLFTTKPKEKRFLILAVEPLLISIISTEIFERYRNKNPKAIPHQVLVSPDGTPCFDHDCYVDCWKLWEEFTLDDIVQSCVNGDGQILGVASLETRLKIIEAVLDSPTFTRQDQNIISSSLSF